MTCYRWECPGGGQTLKPQSERVEIKTTKEKVQTMGRRVVRKKVRRLKRLWWHFNILGT